MVRQGGAGACAAFEADVTKEATLAATMEEACRRFGRIDVLHYNVGMSIAGGDAPPEGSPRRRSTASSRSTCAAR